MKISIGLMLVEPTTITSSPSASARQTAIKNSYEVFLCASNLERGPDMALGSSISCKSSIYDISVHGDIIFSGFMCKFKKPKKTIQNQNPRLVNSSRPDVSSS